MSENKSVIYLAGGCFWGIEKLMHSIPGVMNATSGYANGNDEADANYETVCTKNTGFRETVKVEYDASRVSLEMMLAAYFYVINPSQKNRQGNDVGTQYQTGIYYIDHNSKETVERIASTEAGRVNKFEVEIEPLHCFYPAEEYHQRYLDKNPQGYCHIPAQAIELFSRLSIDPGAYRKPSSSMIKEQLSDLEFQVTQKNGTERPFASPYWNLEDKGIYVDITTGEPLFSSKDKYESSCGWPSFSAPIEQPVLFTKEDVSHGMIRNEVRSRVGDAHLGHVFEGDPESPNGIRYCINGASLRFIPFEEMEAEGYGYLKSVIQ